MGATLYREHKVFRMNLGLGGDGDPGKETVIVAALHCEKNCYPHSYSWSFEFIGGADRFINRYLPEAAYYFDDGLSQGTHLPNGDVFQQHIQRLYKVAGPLTVKELHAMGFHGYRWPESYLSKISDHSHLKVFTDYLGSFCAGKLDTDKDIEKMILEACEVVPPDAKNIGLGCLWRLNEAQVAQL